MIKIQTCDDIIMGIDDIVFTSNNEKVIMSLDCIDKFNAILEYERKMKDFTISVTKKEDIYDDS